jgi:hypothetical protein
MSFTTANTVVQGALLLLGVNDPEDTPSNAMLADGFRRLNMMMGQWSLQELTIPAVGREVYPVVAGKGNPDNPYTVGPGGNLNTSRPQKLDGLGLLLNAGLTTEVEIPRALYTDQAYQVVQVKRLTNGLFTGGYYSPSFAGGFGELFLWPVPDGSQLTSLVIYRLTQLGLFTSPTAQYDLPEGADEAIEYNLAIRLSDVYAVDAQRILNLTQIARSSLAIFKRSNYNLTDMPVDPMFANDRRGGYNINTGDGG